MSVSSDSQVLGSYHQFVNDGLVTLDRRALKREHRVFALRRDAISEDRKRFVLGFCVHKDSRGSDDQKRKSGSRNP